jgi:hypothetical protein
MKKNLWFCTMGPLVWKQVRLQKCRTSWLQIRKHHSVKSFKYGIILDISIMWDVQLQRWLNELGNLDYLTTHTSLSPIRHGFASGFVNYKKGCTRLAAASDKVYQLLAHGRWFSPGTPASSTTKTGHHDIAEILLKVALNTKNQNLVSVCVLSFDVGFTYSESTFHSD